MEKSRADLRRGKDPCGDQGSGKRERASGLYGTKCKKLHGTFLKLDTPNLDVSSHELREWIREGKSVKYYLPDSVISYIQEQKIYQE